MIGMIICGLGKMGRTLMEACQQDSEIKVAGVVENACHPSVGKPIGYGENFIVSGSLEECIKKTAADVIIDFSIPEATISHLKAAVLAGMPMVIGTTGFSDEQTAIIRKGAEKIPIVLSPNFSTGINVVEKMLSELAGLLPDWDVEIIEKHHNQKVDAPSGTANRLANTVMQARVYDPLPTEIYSRFGESCKRRTGEVGVFAVRAGDILGEHEITIAGQGQRIELNHRAHSRDCYAQGAIQAAGWVFLKPPGLYCMQDVLELR